ncbi:hypothetical protein HI914_06394 [Erysiphe necator]|nr:hypothetical protein HI914_06394 [Erysiphe necator]
MSVKSRALKPATWTVMFPINAIYIEFNSQLPHLFKNHMRSISIFMKLEHLARFSFLALFQHSYG